jgi:SAM-dependent methyltransferase
MSSTFSAHDAGNYDRLMGRWSRLLAGKFLDFAGLSDGERIVDVGCGTGSLTFTLTQTANIAAVDAIDYADVYVEAIRARNTDARVNIRQGDACALPYGNESFDRALSLLVLQFIPEPARAIAEMRRVTRPGGVVAAAVWDSYGGMVIQRMFWDTAAVLDPAGAAARAHSLSRPITREGAMKAAWQAAGLVDVAETSLTIRMDYACFDDWWEPIAGGEGSLGAYVLTLSATLRATLEKHLRAAYESGEPDGPRSFAATAWACRGTVPRDGSAGRA